MVGGAACIVELKPSLLKPTWLLLNPHLAALGGHWRPETSFCPLSMAVLSSNATKTSRLGSFASPTLIHGAFSLLKGTNQHILMIGYIDIYKLLKETELINR